jgi:hypothetical protein
MSDPTICKKCGSLMERRPNMFHWRGRFFHVLVCFPCNALWDDPTDSFEQHVSNQARADATEGTGE